jgi:hypothetical protein
LFSKNQNITAVGIVTSMIGKATVERNKIIINLSEGFYVHQKDKIKTFKDSKLQLTFNDNTVISLGQNSNFNIQSYFYDENQLEKTALTFGFYKGIFRSITGKIGKINPDKFKLKTKTATIGIRGTTFFIEKNENEETMSCTTGVITVGTKKNTKVVKKNQFTSVKKDGRLTKPAVIPPEKLKLLTAEFSEFNKQHDDVAKVEEENTTFKNLELLCEPYSILDGDKRDESFILIDSRSLFCK